MALNSSISNILGTKIPYWLWQQLKNRSEKTASEYRDAEVIKFITNKTAWVRLVSSIDIKEDDLNWFKKINPEIAKGEDLAKQYVLFGGTSKYLSQNSYGFRSGFSGLGSNPSYGGAYGIIGDTKSEMGNEISNYGYRPMPGITNVSIETQGKLGSVRAATVNFKCWDKMQLDIIDALYFKLGFSMFLEWGQTYYFPSENSNTALGDAENAETRPDPNKAISTELYSIDPFDQNYRNNKERLFRTIAENNRKTEGNYDAMLGIVTNFNFSMNQEGGYDCTMKIISLGVLGDSIKVNHSSKLVNILEEQIKEYESTLKAINAAPVSGSTTPPTDETVITPLIQKYLAEGKSPSGPNGSVFLSPEEEKASGKLIKESGKEYIYFPTFNRFLNLDEERAIQLTLDTQYIKSILTKVGVDETLKTVSRKIDNAPASETSNILNKTPGWEKFAPDWIYGVKYSPLVNRSEGISPGRTYDIYRNKLDSAVYNNSVNSDFELSFNFNFTNGDNTVPLGDLKNYRVGNQTLDTYLAEYVGKGGYVLDSGTDFKISFEGFKVPELDASAKVIDPSVGDAFVKRIAYDNFYSFVNTQFNTGTQRSKISVREIGPNTFEPVFEVESIVPVTINTKITIEDLATPQGVEVTRSSLNTIQESGFLGIVTGTGIGTVLTVPVTYYFKLKLKFTDAKFIKSFTTVPELEAFQPAQVPSQPAAAPQTADSAQTVNPFTYLSNIELMLRSTQVHSLVIALTKFGTRDPQTNQEGVLLDQVVPVNLIGDDSQSGGRGFVSQLFSNGIFTKYLSGSNALINNTIGDQITGDLENDLAVYVKYGFATKLMANQAPVSKFTRVEYGNSKDSLMNTYVFPHNVTQELESGLAINHPVYIQFGLFLMMLNHSCTLYNPEAKVPSPVVYIDFNPNHNFCLTTPIHLTVDPMIAVIPFEGSLSQYAKLFDKDLLSKEERYSLRPVSGSTDTTFLLRPRNVQNYLAKDRVSGAIPAFIDNKSINDNLNRGRVMNILLNIDYLANTIKQYAKKDGENKVFLKPLLEQILTDVNKALGNLNIFRLAYNDTGNVFHIVDDQIVPVGDQNEQQPYTIKQPGDDPTEIPVFGKKSIAKNLEIKTDVSTRLSNMLAISANSQGEQGQNSTDGSTFGFINYNYSDRYITKRSELETTGSNSIDINGELEAATQFNEAMLNFYSRGILDQNSIGTATNYYISKLTKNKAEDSATRAAAMIPVSLNFTTDGISGLYMGQAFTVSKDFLPYTYSIKKMFNNEPADNKVGFVITGVNHTIEGNVWNTAVKTNMIFLKSKSDYPTGSLSERNIEPVSQNTANTGNTGVVTNRSDIKTSYPELPLIDPPPPTELLSYSEAKKILLRLTNPDTAKSVFAILWAEASKKDNSFSSAGGHNYAGVQTDSGRWGKAGESIAGRFIRKDSKRLREFAKFNSDADFLKFMVDRVTAKGFSSADSRAWSKTYLNSWVYLNLEKQNKAEYDRLFPFKVNIFNTAASRFDKLA